ncbi:ubiquinone/menaquinone biosynthesis methylase [Oleiphilus messinensis]|uniref:Ubiquinone/menaquinone biosynthesis methylase n=1 Tax=Oleiphilus messinensis TaxID=141451 RepID=A0A1Y0I208_9GAMM|nr:class I SAM-dependent methyltransferase [Oleiphilus messinensis]ARU54249.1 ubiquinone/menaquinone biosynthesis methylase [Oleiphilus messinensis]
MKDKYWLMGPVYDALSFVFAGNAIYRCKCSMLTPEYLKEGDKILFAGVGHGKEAIYAAEHGAEVTVVDLSEAMLDKFREAIAKTGKELNIRIVHSDIMTFDERGKYDMVVANFFLNVFDETFMAKVLAHLITQGKADAYVVVGDFALPEGSVMARAVKRVYWYSAIALFWATTGAAMHPVYDYFRHMKQQGLDILDKKHTQVLGFNAYTALIGRKSA